MWMSSRPLAISRSKARRWAGVYSWSAIGGLQKLWMTPLETLNSTWSPVLIPALRRTLGSVMKAPVHRVTVSSDS